MNNPLISIIVPIYKVEEYLEECVQSLLKQTYQNLEIILVDDGSPDNCPQMCDNYAQKDKRIKVIHKKNGGLSSARNAGLDIAKGEYIGFVDSDDFISENAIEILYNQISMDVCIAIVSGMIYRYFDGNLSPFNSRWKTDCKRMFSYMDFRIKVMDMSISHTVWNKLYRAKLLNNVRFREGRNNEDVLFMYDLSKEMKRLEYCVVEIPQYVYFYRYRDDSICTSTKKPLFIDKIQNQIDMMNDCEKSDKELYNVIYNEYVRSLYLVLDNLLLNDIWRSLYFNKYQLLLRKISCNYVIHHFNFKDSLYIFLLKWIPNIRKCIRLLLIFLRKF